MARDPRTRRRAALVRMLGMPELRYSTPSGELGGYLATPSDAGPHPGVVVIQDALGLSDDIRAQADRLAGAGYLAFAPDLYSGRGIRCVVATLSASRSGRGPAYEEIEAARKLLAEREDCSGQPPEGRTADAAAARDRLRLQRRSGRGRLAADPGVLRRAPELTGTASTSVGFAIAPAYSTAVRGTRRRAGSGQPGRPRRPSPAANPPSLTPRSARADSRPRKPACRPRRARSRARDSAPSTWPWPCRRRPDRRSRCSRSSSRPARSPSPSSCP
jgi:hypothetical protein